MRKIVMSTSVSNSLLYFVTNLFVVFGVNLGGYFGVYFVGYSGVVSDVYKTDVIAKIYTFYFVDWTPSVVCLSLCVIW